MSQKIEKGYWWECTKCEQKHQDLKIMKLLFELSRSGWDQKVLYNKCSNAECNGHFKIAFYYSKKEKKVALLQHVVGITYDDKIREPINTPFGDLLTVTDYLPMMWEWKYKNIDDVNDSFFDFKYISTAYPNPKTLTSILSLTEGELKRIIELYREITGSEHFLL